MQERWPEPWELLNLSTLWIACEMILSSIGHYHAYNCAALDDHQQDTAKWHYGLFYLESNVYMDIVYRLCSNNFIHSLSRSTDFSAAHILASRFLKGQQLEAGYLQPSDSRLHTIDLPPSCACELCSFLCLAAHHAPHLQWDHTCLFVPCHLIL